MNLAELNKDVLKGDEVISLKEITDILEVRHNDAMKKVESLSKEPSFGELRKTRISYAKGKTVGTYVLNKIQAIAVGAKLNDTLLMKLVKRLEEPNSKLMETLADHTAKTQALFHTQEVMGEVITEHESRIKNLELNRRLESWQEKNLQDAKNRKVYELASSTEDEKKRKELVSKLHMKVWSVFKKRFNLPRYNELTAGRYEDGLMYLNNLTMAEVV